MAIGFLTILIVMRSAVRWNPSRVQSAQPPSKANPVHFTDVPEAAGITFQHEATMTPEKNYIETMGNGVGWIDYDKDGYLDLLICNYIV